MRITAKGQVTIPQEIRESAGLLPDTEVEFRLDENGVYIVKVRDPLRPSRGQKAVAALRRGAGRVTMSTDDIMALTREDS